MRITKLSLGMLMLLIPLVNTPQAFATTFSAANDFSLASNPNGVWSYGYSTILGGTFTLDAITNTTTFSNSNFSSWQGNENDVTDFLPLVVKNTANTPQQGFGANLLPGELALHPSSNGEFAIVRFTAPNAGLFGLTTTFEGRDNINGTTTDVHVLLNNASLFSGNVLGFGPGPTSDQMFVTTLPLNAGDKLDFLVGVGTDGLFFSDTTALSATITSTAVPEPSTWLLFGSGLVGLILWRKRTA